MWSSRESAHIRFDGIIPEYPPLIRRDFRRYLKIFHPFFVLYFFRLLPMEIHKIRKIKHLKNYLKAVYICTVFRLSFLWKKLKKSGPETVLYFYWAFGSIFSLLILGKIKSQVVFRLHGGDIFEELPIYEGYIPFREKIFEVADSIIPIAYFSKNYLIEKYPKFKKKYKVFYLGTKDYSKDRRPKKVVSTTKALHIVSCSTMIKEKRVHAILECLRNIPFNLKWTHLGGGPLLEELKEKAKNQLRENICYNFLGNLSHENVFKFYINNSVDIFVTLSFTEGLPVSIMEAMSFSIPIMATNVGGISEIVDSKNGYLLTSNPSTKEVLEKLYEFKSLSKKNRLSKGMISRERWEKLLNGEKNFKKFSRFLINSSI